MARSTKKPVFYDLYLLIKILKATNKDKPIKTYSRSSSIIPEMIGYTFQVYNGKKFIPVVISEYMIGHKLGEYSQTRKYAVHSEKAIVKKGVKK